MLCCNCCDNFFGQNHYYSIEESTQNFKGKYKSLPVIECSQYQQITFVGSGRYSNVFRAYDNISEQIVAIKIFKLIPNTSLNVDSFNEEDILREIYTLSLFQHQHIIKYYGSLVYSVPISSHISNINHRENNDNKDNQSNNEEVNEIWMIMEYLDINLTDVIHDNIFLHEIVTATIILAIVKSLVYIHSQDFIHCDLKSSNVLLSLQGDIKLIDFGFALELSLPSSLSPCFQGTPLYMAPEMVQHKLSQSNILSISPAIDIWSLGILIIEMCLGEPPLHEYCFNIPTVYQKILEHNSFSSISNDTSLYHLPSHFSTELRDFVQQCCQSDPIQRPSAFNLLSHPFLQNTNINSLKHLIEKALKNK